MERERGIKRRGESERWRLKEREKERDGEKEKAMESEGDNVCKYKEWERMGDKMSWVGF